MGDSADFHFGKQPAGSGLEFVGQRKRSLFSQYTAQFNGTTAQQPQPIQSPQQPTQQQYPTYQDAQAQQYAVAQQQQEQHAQDPQDYDSLFDEDDEVMNDIPALNIQHNSTGEVRRTKGKNLHKSKKDKSERPSTLKVIAMSFASFVGIAIVVVSALYIVNNKPAISTELKAQAGFPVIDMVPNNVFTVDKNSVEINKNGSLVYTVYQKDNNAKFIVSQQAVPDLVKEDTQYQQFLTQTDKFASLESDLGKVYFTKPPGIGTDISAVVKSSDTLMFIRADGTTSEQSWKSLISVLQR